MVAAHDGPPWRTHESHHPLSTFCSLAVCVLLWPVGRADAQGVTTGAITGVVKDAQGAVIPGATVIAVHQPSGTHLRGGHAGRRTIRHARHARRRSVHRHGVASRVHDRGEEQHHASASASRRISTSVSGRRRRRRRSPSSARAIRCSARRAPARPRRSRARSSRRCRPSPAASRDITRLTPQYGGNGSFAGQDNRAEQHDGRRLVLQQLVRPRRPARRPHRRRADLARGDRAGAGQRRAVRRAPGQLHRRRRQHRHPKRHQPAHAARSTTASRNEAYVGTEAARPDRQSRHLQRSATPACGPAARSSRTSCSSFGNYENEEDTRPLTTFSAESRAASRSAATSRASSRRISTRSARSCSTNFNYDTGPFDDIPTKTPGQARACSRATTTSTRQQGQLPLQPARLEHRHAAVGLVVARHRAGRPTRTSFLSFANSNYSILENIKSGIGEWNSVFGSTMSNNLLVGYTKQDESRGARIKLFPFVDILRRRRQRLHLVRLRAVHAVQRAPLQHVPGAGQLHEVRERTTRSPSAASVEKLPLRQLVLLLHRRAPTSTTRSPTSTPTPTATSRTRTARCRRCTLSSFQVQYLQHARARRRRRCSRSTSIYTGGYVQDEWRPKANLTVTAGLRFDVPKFDNTAFDNPAADALTFRDQDGSPVQYNSGALPEHDALLVAARRLELGRQRRSADAGARRHGPLHGQAAVRLDFEPDRQHRRADRVRPDRTTPTAFPFNPNPDKYKPAPTGAPAASYELDVTDQDFRFPQTWRTQHRRRPPAAVGPDRHARLHLQPRRQRHRSTSTPTCRRRSRPSPASTTARAGSRHAALAGMRRDREAARASRG